MDADDWLKQQKQQEQYEADYKRGYAAFVGNEPPQKDTAAWLDGWKEARQKAAEAEGVTQMQSPGA